MKHYAPNICLPLKVAKYAKGPNSKKILQNLFKHSTKFQAPSSNSYRDILLTSLKCPNLQRA